MTVGFSEKLDGEASPGVPRWMVCNFSKVSGGFGRSLLWFVA